MRVDGLTANFRSGSGPLSSYDEARSVLLTDVQIRLGDTALSDDTISRTKELRRKGRIFLQLRLHHFVETREQSGESVWLDQHLKGVQSFPPV